MKNIPFHLEAERAGHGGWKEKLGPVCEPHNTGYDGGSIESGPFWVVPYPQVYEWLTKIVWINGIGYTIVRSSSTFYFH